MAPWQPDRWRSRWVDVTCSPWHRWGCWRGRRSTVTHHQDLTSVASYETTLSSWMLAQICSFILFLFGKSHLCVSFMSLVTHVFGQCFFLSHEKVLNFAGRPSALTPPPPKKRNKSRYSEFHKTFLQMSEVDSRLELLLLASWSCLYMLLWQPAGSGIDYHGNIDWMSLSLCIPRQLILWEVFQPVGFKWRPLALIWCTVGEGTWFSWQIHWISSKRASCKLAKMTTSKGHLMNKGELSRCQRHGCVVNQLKRSSVLCLIYGWFQMAKMK